MRKLILQNFFGMLLLMLIANFAHAQNWEQIQKVYSGDAELNGWFGYSVDIEGDYAVFGAKWEDHSGLSDAGSVYVFKNDGSDNWTQIAKLTAGDAANGDTFGGNVRISGNYIAISADREAPGGISNAGSVYIFKNDGSDNFTQVAKVSASDADINDFFGNYIDFEGNYLVVGAWYEDPAAKHEAGSVYIFKNDGSDNFAEIAKLTASNGGASDNFGESVSISGNYIAVGARGANPSFGDTGSVYIFKNDGADNFSEISRLDCPVAEVAAKFGDAVSIDGDYLLVGTGAEDSNGLANAGSAYMFKNDGADNFTQIAKLLSNDLESDDFFGFELTLSGNYALISAQQENYQGKHFAGSAYVFKNDGADNWTQIDKLNADDADADESFSSSVAISGDYMLIGARVGDSDVIDDAGSAYFFKPLAAPSISGQSLAANNSYVDITFTEGIYTNSNGSGALQVSDLQLVFNANGGTAFSASIAAVTKNDATDVASATALSGGESTVRVFINVAGVVQGSETVELQPTDGSSLYSSTGFALAGTETTGALTLNALPATSLTFNGSGDYVDFGANTNFDFGTGNFTYEFKLKTSVRTFQGVLVKRDVGMNSQYMAFNIIEGRMEAWLNNKRVFNSTLAETANDAWHTYALVRNGNTFTLYIDGADVGSNTVSGSVDNTAALVAGKYFASLNLFFLSGNMDDLRIWNKALPVNELHQARVGNEPNLIGYYLFRQVSGNTLIDMTGQGNNGTIR